MAVYLGSNCVCVKGGTKNITGGVSLQDKTVTPSESAQTVKADSAYDGLGTVTVNAVSSTYIGSGITQKGATTYTPSTSNQTIASGTYLSGAQTIKGDSNLVAGNIKSGVSIFGVSGTYSGSSGSSTPTLQSKTVTPTTSKQTVTPDSGYDGLSSVTVNAITTATQATPSISVSSSGLITASSTQDAGYVTSGTKSATKQLTTKAATTYTPGTSSQTIASGTYLTGTQTISGDSNLVASNIKSGVSIFGVAGTYTGSSSGSSMAMKTGTTTSATISTGLSSISALVIYKSSFSATGLIQGVYNGSTLYYTYCSSYSYYFKTVTTDTSTASSTSGGTFTLGTSGTSGLSSSTTYNWIAFGEA